MHLEDLSVRRRGKTGQAPPRSPRCASRLAGRMRRAAGVREDNGRTNREFRVHWQFNIN